MLDWREKVNKLYRFVYEDKVVFESYVESEVDDFVDQWVNKNFDALDEFANGNLFEENVDEQQTWFKAEHIKEVS